MILEKLLLDIYQFQELNQNNYLEIMKLEYRSTNMIAIDRARRIPKFCKSINTLKC
jgi:hypothetical protein